MGVSAQQCSCSITPSGSEMYQVLVVILLVSTSLQGDPSQDRDGKSLVNTFPFNSNNQHQNHHEDHVASEDLSVRDQRQRAEDSPPSFSEVASTRPGFDGKRCIDKVLMVEEIECEENFRKSCFIEYEKIAFNETVKVCRTPLVKDCDVKGPEICRTEYESECWTKQEVHDVTDDVVSCETVVEEKCEDETSGYTTNTKCST